MTRALTAAPPTTTAAAPSGAAAPVRRSGPAGSGFAGSGFAVDSRFATGSRLAAHGGSRLAAHGGSRPARRARRLGRWRPLTATLVLSGLLGAGATAAVTMTAGSAPAHAAQSAPRTTPAQTLAPASTPASATSSAPDASYPRHPRAGAARDRAGLHTAAEHAARNHDPAAEFQRAAEPDDVPEPDDLRGRLAPAPTTATPAAQQRGY